MLDKLNLYLRVQEIVTDEGIGSRTMYIPITSKIEGMKLDDIPEQLGMEKVALTVNYEPDDRSDITNTIVNTSIEYKTGGDINIAEYAVFSLMHALVNETYIPWPIEEEIRKNGVDCMEVWRKRSKMVYDKLALLMDRRTLDGLWDRVRSLRSYSEIYDLIDKLGILYRVKEPSSMQSLRDVSNVIEKLEVNKEVPKGKK